MLKFVFTKLRHTIKNWTDGEKKLRVKLIQLGMYRHNNRIAPVHPCVLYFAHRRSFILYIHNYYNVVILLQPVQFTTTKTKYNKLNENIEQCFVGK